MKTLKDVVIAVQHELDCSISELSRKLGKSRNYLFTHLKNGLSAEKEQEIISSLLKLVDSENKKLKKALDKMSNLCILIDKDFTSTVHERDKEIGRLQDTIATKDLFIDGQDKEIENLKADHDKNCNNLLNSIRILSTDIESREKSMEALAKAGHNTDNILRKEKQKTRTLSLGIIAIAVVSTIALWWLS